MDFKVGDQVLIINLPKDFNDDYYRDAINKKGIITEITESGIIIIDNNEYGVNFKPENIISCYNQTFEYLDKYIEKLTHSTKDS